MSRAARRSASPARAQAPAPRPRGSLLARVHPGVWGALAAVLLHLPALGFGFVRDDHALLERNLFLRGGFPFTLLGHDFWASAEGASGLWRPLVLATYWLDLRLGHGAALLPHAVNLGVHALVVALVAAVVLQSGASRVAALLASLAFAALPAHVESVAWISGRTDLLCAAFLLGALLLDGRARRGGRRGPGWAAVTLWALALLSKETAAGFLVFVALADWIGRPRAAPAARLRWLLPYAVVAGAWLVAHERFSDRPVYPPSVEALTIARRGWAGWTMLPTDLGFLWPGFPHSPDYMLRLPRGPGDPAVVAGALLALAALALTVALAARRRRLALPVALVWLPIAPAMFVAITRGYGFYGERHVYLPSIGAAWLLALGWDAAWARLGRGAAARAGRAALAAAAVGGVGWSVAVSLELLPAWRSDATLFRDMTRRQPEYAVGHAGWANALAAAHRDADALREFAIADSLDPRLPEVPLSLATLYARRGDWNRALAEASRAARMDPRRLQARRLEATAYLRLNRVEEGRRTLQAILDEVPKEPRTEALLGQLLMTERRFAEARPLLERSARWVDDDPSLTFALGTVRLETGDVAGAREALERTVLLEPDFYDGWLRLALVCALQGDAGGRDRALARASSLPEARDGRVEQVRRLIEGGAGR